MVDWFRRLADIPGVGYEGSVEVDRRKLPGHDAVSEVQAFESEGKRREVLWWPSQGGGGSASPAHARAFSQSRDVPTPALLRNLYEGVELPGKPGDYHFLIQGCAEELWKRRIDDWAVLEEVDKPCWLDIRLIEARPDAVSGEHDGDTLLFYNVRAFSILVNLYEREGFLHEALDVTNRAARFEQGEQERQRLIQRIAAVEAEGGE